ncbi:MAG: hypothetical protein M3300_13330 [Actinomycetota bacterium]|nr:hypothetical protein [Actinomycetota bacterium]
MARRHGRSVSSTRQRVRLRLRGAVSTVAGGAMVLDIDEPASTRLDELAANATYRVQ